MIINLNDIPKYFEESDLYKRSILTNTYEIDIDVQFTKFDEKIENSDDLCYFLDTIQYWNFTKHNYPIEIFSILDKNKLQDFLYKYEIKNKYSDLGIIDEISFIHKKRPNICYKPKIVKKNSLSYLEGNHLIEDAAEISYLGVIKYALKIGYFLTDLVALKSAEKGYSNILKFCFDNISKMKYIENRMERSKYNDIIFSKILYDEVQPKCYFNSICRHAAKNGHLDCLILAHKFGCLWNERVCIDAAIRGHYECLKYAHENGCSLTKDVCYYASAGHKKCLEYAHMNGCPWDSKLYEHAIISGDLECIMYAYENGCPWNDKICEDAALLNFYDILKYAIDNNAPKSSRVSNCAASKGNFECLKYAHENGCDFDEDTCYDANRGKNVDCIIYVHENGCLCTMDNDCLLFRVNQKNGKKVSS
jgi:hypothetical protein